MSSKNSNHIARINSDIFRVLTVALRQKLGDIQFSDINIIRVETSADLSETKVYVNQGTDVLERAAGFLRNEIAGSIKMKQAPRLRFIIDKGIKNAERVEELLKQISKTVSN